MKYLEAFLVGIVCFVTTFLLSFVLLFLMPVLCIRIPDEVKAGLESFLTYLKDCHAKIKE